MRASLDEVLVALRVCRGRILAVSDKSNSRNGAFSCRFFVCNGVPWGP